MDYFKTSLESKKKELQQAEESYNELFAALQEVRRVQQEAKPTAAAKKTSTTATKRTNAKVAAGKAKKTTKATKKVKEEIDDEEEETTANESEPTFSETTVKYVVENSIAALNFSLQHRAGFMFLAAAATIFFYGDYASV